MHQRKQKIVLKGFQFKVDELVIDQETSELGMSVPDTALKAIGQVISAPQQLLGIESDGNVIHAATPAVPLPEDRNGTLDHGKPRRRRRGRKSSTPDDAVPSSEDTFESKVRTSSNGTSARSLVEEIQSEGFFAQDRTIADIREELLNRGHSFKSNEISPSLVALTKNKTLSRKKGENGQFVYRDGTNGQR